MPFYNDAEGGTHLTAVTPANSGGASGDAFSTVSLGASTAIEFSNVQESHGALSYRNITSGTSLQYLEFLPTPANSFAIRFYLYLTGAPTSANGLMRVLTAGGGTTLAHLVFKNNMIELQNGTGGVLWTSGTTALPTAQWLRCEIGMTSGTGTGTYKMDWYLLDSTTPITNLSVDLAGQTFGTFQIGRIRLGRTYATGSVADFYIDSIGYEESTTTYIGPHVEVDPDAPMFGTLTQVEGKFIDLTGVTFAVGPGTFSVSPTTGVIETDDGMFLPPGTYTITANDTGNSTSTDQLVVVAAGGTSAVSEMVVWDGAAWV